MRRKLGLAYFLGLTLAAVGGALADTFEQGKDYSELAQPQPGGGDNVEVIEFFSYGCPHCAHFEPYLQEWKDGGKPDNVELRRVPVAWNRGFEAFARVYYAADMLGASDEAHAAMFRLLHEDKPTDLTLPMIADLFAEHGLDRAAFLRNFESQDVTARVREGQEMTRRYRVTGVPVLIVDGAYSVPSPAGGDFPRMLAVADYLAERSAPSP